MRTSKNAYVRVSREMPLRPTPMAPGTSKRDAHIVGYYVLVYADTTAQGEAVGRGLRASGRGRAKAAPKRRFSVAKRIIKAGTPRTPAYQERFLEIGKNRWGIGRVEVP
jgi:hypothetical protein